MKSKKPIVAENRYRLTFRASCGTMHLREVTASSLSVAVSGNNDPSDLVKVERIHPKTGAVLGGFYNE